MTSPGKWHPDAITAERQRRTICIKGQFVNCRHFQRLATRAFLCKKTGVEKTTCENCTNCPSCDGRLALQQQYVCKLHNHLHLRDIFICVHCGVYLERTYMQNTGKKEEKTKISECAVDGCQHITHEGHLYRDIDNGVPRTWTICESHSRRVKTWRYNQSKGLDDKPILCEAGRLIDNPKYRRKTGA